MVAPIRIAKTHPIFQKKNKVGMNLYLKASLIIVSDIL